VVEALFLREDPGRQGLDLAVNSPLVLSQAGSFVVQNRERAARFVQCFAPTKPPLNVFERRPVGGGFIVQLLESAYLGDLAHCGSTAKHPRASRAGANPSAKRRCGCRRRKRRAASRGRILPNRYAIQGLMAPTAAGRPSLAVQRYTEGTSAREVS